MQKKLKWNAIGFESKIKALKQDLEKKKAGIPSNATNRFRKTQNYVDEINQLSDTLDRINTDLIPTLEKKFRLQFPTPELIYIAMSRGGFKNIIETMQAHLKDETSLNPSEFEELQSICEAADVLALIGDAVLDLAIVQEFWDVDLSTVGSLTNKRKEFVKNDNLAIVCDSWSLYDYRLDRTIGVNKDLAKEPTMNHEKGTLVESIFGVVYFEFGFDEVLRLLPLLQYPN